MEISFQIGKLYYCFYQARIISSPIYVVYFSYVYAHTCTKEHAEILKTQAKCSDKKNLQ